MIHQNYSYDGEFENFQDSESVRWRLVLKWGRTMLVYAPGGAVFSDKHFPVPRFRGVQGLKVWKHDFFWSGFEVPNSKFKNLNNKIAAKLSWEANFKISRKNIEKCRRSSNISDCLYSWFSAIESIFFLNI